MHNSRTFFSIETRVNKDDIARGNKDEPESCPVARSLKRTLKSRFRRWGEVKVAVGANHAVLLVPAKVSGGHNEMIAKLNPNARAFVESFDAGSKVDPGSLGYLSFDFNRYIP